STSLAGRKLGSLGPAAGSAAGAACDGAGLCADGPAGLGTGMRTDARTAAVALIDVPPPRAAMPLGGGTDGTRVGSGDAAGDCPGPGAAGETGETGWRGTTAGGAGAGTRPGTLATARVR